MVHADESRTSEVRTELELAEVITASYMRLV